jgi:hypothetical protein
VIYSLIWSSLNYYEFIKLVGARATRWIPPLKELLQCRVIEKKPITHSQFSLIFIYNKTIWSNDLVTWWTKATTIVFSYYSVAILPKSSCCTDTSIFMFGITISQIWWGCWKYVATLIKISIRWSEIRRISWGYLWCSNKTLR